MGYLFIIPARDEPVALILRRGPTDWYHLIQWDTRRDTFTHGAWMKGRIYEEKCDLSTDGRLFIYVVRKMNSRDAGFTHAWTAISRPPWLHALVVWPQGTTYGGGGRFIGPQTLWGDRRTETHADYPLPDRLKFLMDSPKPEPRETKSIVPDADWSGEDQAGHVIYTRGYQLFRRIKRRDVLVADFADLKPDPAPPPEWATRPL